MSLYNKFSSLFLDTLIVYLQAGWLESYVLNLMLIGEIYNYIVLTLMFETRLKALFHSTLQSCDVHWLSWDFY